MIIAIKRWYIAWLYKRAAAWTARDEVGACSAIGTIGYHFPYFNSWKMDTCFRRIFCNSATGCFVDFYWWENPMLGEDQARTIALLLMSEIVKGMTDEEIQSNFPSV